MVTPDHVALSILMLHLLFQPLQGAAAHQADDLDHPAQPMLLIL
jgi:hypothetical protein